jgi:SAM-dependent methyltransferase
MDQMSAGWLDTMLVQQWIPSVDGLAGRLADGARVADAGCGGGRALVLLAQAFPRSQFVGYDSNPASIERAEAAAREAGVTDRVSFVGADASDALDGHFDLVTAFDMLHDAPDPARLLRQIATAVRPDGVLLLLESNAADEPLDNTGAVATILYATSVLYCLPVSRDAGGPGLGTLGLPPGRIREWCAASGFRSIRAVPGANPFNRIYEIRP